MSVDAGFPAVGSRRLIALNCELQKIHQFLGCLQPVSYTHLTLPTIYSV